MENLRDFERLSNRMLIRLEMVITKVVHLILDGELVEVSDIDWLWERMPVKWQEMREKSETGRPPPGN